MPLLTILLFKVTDSIRDTTDSISFSLSLTLYVPSESSGNEADPVQNSFWIFSILRVEHSLNYDIKC